MRRATADGVMQIAITDDVVLRTLRADDRDRLACYFESLSPSTTTGFQPHPLTREQAILLCSVVGSAESEMRLVLEHEEGVIGYFILEHTVRAHDAARTTGAEPGRERVPVM